MKAKIYGAPFWQSQKHLWTPSLILVRHQSISRATQNFFNQFSVYLYATGTIFCKHVFLFFATLNIFSQHESSFEYHITFFVDTTYIFVTRIILLCNVNFYARHFFLLTRQFFCATQGFFVLPNVSIKNVVNNEKQI